MPSNVFVIAEAGSCHDKDWRQAVELIRIAGGAGANAVKFQYFSNANRLADRRRAKELLPIYERYALPMDWIAPLAQHCHQVGIDFMCTTYLPEDIKVVAPFVTKFKIASFEALDRSFLSAHPMDRDILISLGMVSGHDLPTLLERRRANPLIRYLHCVSGYPTPLNEVNLSVIHHYALDGFSDHTRDLHMGADAVLAGARIVEVHFRTSETSLENPDYTHSLSPHELQRYIGNIRVATVRLGEPVKCVQPSERENLNYQVFTT